MPRFTVPVFLAIAVFSFAQGAERPPLEFSTPGPDVYADGTPVLPGEVYALVWTRDGVKFEGVDLDGRPVNSADNAVVVAASLAKRKKTHDGRVVGYLPSTVFTLPENFAESHPNGRYAICLFDTRRSNGVGGLVPFRCGESRLTVHGWGIVDGFVAQTPARLQAVVPEEPPESVGLVAATSSALPADEVVPKLRITSLRVEEDRVVLKVTGTHPRLLYGVASGGNPGCEDRTHAAAEPQVGRDDAADEVTLEVPKRDGQTFFRVVREP